MNRLDVILTEAEYRIASYRFQLASPRNTSRECNPVLVNGTPKTGTTWMTHLIGSIPGYWMAGHFGNDINKYLGALPGSVIHGHAKYSSKLASALNQKKIRVIVMLRDPRDQCVSRMFHIRRDTTNPFHSVVSSMTLSDALMLCIEGNNEIPNINQHMQISLSWENAEHDVLSVKYEDLNVSPVQEFRRVLHHLDIDMADKLIELIVQRNRFGQLSAGRGLRMPVRSPGQEDPNSHFRKGIVGDWQNYFEPRHKHRLNEMAGQILIGLGYAKSLDW